MISSNSIGCIQSWKPSAFCGCSHEYYSTSLYVVAFMVCLLFIKLWDNGTTLGVWSNAIGFVVIISSNEKLYDKKPFMADNCSENVKCSPLMTKLQTLLITILGGGGGLVSLGGLVVCIL